MKYEKPNLEELELLLEGSFLDSRTNPENPDVDIDGGDGGNGEGDGYWN